MKYQNIIKMIKILLKFKEECSKTGTTEEAIAVGEKIGFKTNLIAINPLNPKSKSSSLFCKFCFNGLWFWSCFWLSSS